jgi:Flp pilus assembly pilin Flp
MKFKMNSLLSYCKRYRNELGASMLEYALIAALIAVVGIPAIGFLGTQASRTFDTVATNMEVGGVTGGNDSQ